MVGTGVIATAGYMYIAGNQSKRAAQSASIYSESRHLLFHRARSDTVRTSQNQRKREQVSPRAPLTHLLVRKPSERPSTETRLLWRRLDIEEGFGLLVAMMCEKRDVYANRECRYGMIMCNSASVSYKS